MKNGVKYVLGLGIVADALQVSVNFSKNYCDPTTKHIPIFAPNPERELFNILENFRFQDGYTFDMRGNYSVNNKRKGTLANSNERALKGFAPTYQLTRSIGPIGKYKLDWIFVKSYISKPYDKKASYNFAPHFARTLHTVNYSYPPRISDHNPISVDLPFYKEK